MFILQFAMLDWFANNITHRIFISPGDGWAAKSLVLTYYFAIKNLFRFQSNAAIRIVGGNSIDFRCGLVPAESQLAATNAPFQRQFQSSSATISAAGLPGLTKTLARRKVGRLWGGVADRPRC
ncbi:hypothetical protein LF1_01710 [Rubripirellula obstinata]|uniref:Uncharacterized protein n=1 Tax=Rubripirellula obstinata TaxID=406547 RepID=A0A5B1CDZ4_9BACT|nr:hypothetical protein LF1_01710 [Rubripirellula obstinata]